MSAMTLPVSAKSTWATKTSSPSADGIGESQVTTLMPLACAALAAGTIWSPELLEIMIARDALGGGVGDDLDLAGDAVLGRRPEELQRLRVLQLLLRFERALMRLVEGQDAEELRQQHHVQRLAGRRPCRPARSRG